MKNRVLTVVFGVLAAGLATGQELLLNNSFENGVATSDLMAVIQGGTFIEGWSVDGGTPAQGVNVRSSRYGPADYISRGKQSVQLAGPNGPGRIWQDVTVQPFHNYIIQWSLNTDGPSANETYAVYFNGVEFYRSGQTPQYWYGVSALVSGLASAQQRVEFRSLVANSGPIVDDVYFFKYGTASLVGDIELNGYIGPTDNLDATISLYDNVTGNFVESYPTTLDSASRYEVSLIQTGTFTIVCDGPTWIRQRISSIENYEYVNELNFELILGDVDGSGEIDAVDIDMVIANFGATGMDAADVDGSAEVDATDIDMVIQNFGAVDE